MKVFGLEFQFDLYSQFLSTSFSLADIKTWTLALIITKGLHVI